MIHTCNTKYMCKERLEAVLDELFSAKLTSPAFLERCVGELTQRSERHDSPHRAERLRLELKSLRQRRERTVDSFIDGTISNEDRNRRLSSIDGMIQACEEGLKQDQPAVTPDLTSLVEAFSSLTEWEFWGRDQKRALLATLVPEIRVADYQVQTLGLNPAIFGNEVTHMGTDSLPRPA